MGESVNEEMVIEKALKSYIQNECMLEQNEILLSNDDQLIEKGIVDSLHLLQLIQFIEQEFSITVADEDLVTENFQTINHIKQFIILKKNQKL